MDDTANGKTNLEIKSSRLSTEIKEEPKETYKKLNEDDHTTIGNMNFYLHVHCTMEL